MAIPQTHGEKDRCTGGSSCYRILVVEGDDLTRIYLKGILEREGYQVATAKSAQNARILCRDKELRFDLVISDIILPDGSGSKLCRSFSCPVILISGYTGGCLRNQGAYDGEFPLVTRPIERDSFLSLLEMTLRG